MTLPGPWKATATAGPPPPKPAPLRQPFVYGTLRTGDIGYHMVKGRTLSERVTTVPAYELWVTHDTTWPWAVPSNYYSRRLVGQVMEFPASRLSTEIARLDVYEGYTPGGDISKMRYHRVATTTTDGAPVWIYEATPRLASFAKTNGYRVINGDWFDKRTSNRSYTLSAPRLQMQSGQAPLTAGAIIDVESASSATTCTSELGTLTDGQFLTLDVDVQAPGSTTEGYVGVFPESFVALDSRGLPFVPFTENAKFCNATSDQLQAFVDDGETASGTLVFEGDIAELYWVDVQGNLHLVWEASPQPAPSPSGTPSAEPTDPADLTQPAEPTHSAGR